MPTEQEFVQWNFKTLYAIFNGETATKFKRIITWDSVREAMDIIKITNEGKGTIVVKI